MKIYSISPRNAVIEAAKRAGITLIPIWGPDVPEGFAHLHHLTLADPLDSLELARAMVADGVAYGAKDCLCLGLGDDSSQVAAIVNRCLELGNNQFASFPSLELMRDKYQLRKALGQTASYNGRYWLVSSLDEAKDVLTQCPNGAVIKPIDGSGSLGVTRVSSCEDLESISFQEPLLLEEFFSGAEYSVESLSWAGKTLPLIVTEKHIGGKSGLVEVGQRQPARLTLYETEALFRAAQEILQEVGYHYGISHIEFILQDGVPKLVEAHGRVGGDRIADLMEWSLGASGFELLFRCYRDQKLPTITPTGNQAEIIFPDLRSWSGSDQQWLDAINLLNGVVEAEILRTPQNRQDILSSSDRHAHVVLTGLHTEDLVKKIQKLGV